MLLRTILNTAHRMVYPFLPIFARGLGVDISTMSLLMTVRSLIGVTSPLFAPIADRRGRDFGMLLGALVFTLGVGRRPSINLDPGRGAHSGRIGKIHVRPIHAGILR